MKKTIITLLALAGMAMGEGQETVSTYYTQLNGQDQGYGFILSLSDKFMTYSGGKLGATFDLDSVTMQCGTAGDYQIPATSKLAIFERQGEDSIGTFVGLSESTAFTVGNTTYDFTDVITLDTAKQYQFFWVSSTTTANIFSTTEDNMDEYKTVAVKTRFDKVNVAAAVNSNMNLPTGDGIIFNSNYTGWSDQNMAVVSFNAVPSIPEPATATLSLLALAGLAARRRRK